MNALLSKLFNRKPEPINPAYDPTIQAELKRKRDAAFWASDYGQALGRIVLDNYDSKRNE